MTKREALKDLQNRLAGRLQSARNDPVAASWLAVLVGTRHYLLPLNQSGEIFPLASIARVPYASAWFSGVVNLRGGLYAVVDLAGFLDRLEAPVRGEQAWSEVRLITFNPELEINCALMVDGLAGLRRAEAFSGTQPAPPGSPPFLGKVFLDAQGRQWQELDMRLLSQTADFLNIGT
jgi:twitching motility protein PilI